MFWFGLVEIGLPMDTHKKKHRPICRVAAQQNKFRPTKCYCIEIKQMERI